MYRLFNLVPLFALLLSCAAHEDSPPGDLRQWTFEATSYEFVQALAREGTRSVDDIPGIFVYFFDAEVTCNDADIMTSLYRAGPYVEVFYPVEGETFAPPAAVTFDTPGGSISSHIAPDYQGQLHLDSASSVSGWVKIENTGFNEDSEIIGHFTAVICPAA